MSGLTRRVGFDVGRLVDLDLAFLGPRVIVAEFAVGVAGALGLGVLSLAYAARTGSPAWSWPVLTGLELLAIGLNYVPLLRLALLRRSDAARIADTKLELQNGTLEGRSYGLRQAWILVPGAVVAFALSQARHPDRAGRISLGAP